MDEMMEESRGQTVSGQETNPGLLDDVVQVSVDTDGIVVELEDAEDDPPPDWLEPLEEDYVEDGKEGMESEKSTQTRAKRGGWRKGRRRKVVLDDGWLDCPDLGKGWKQKVIFLRTGPAVGRKIMHYMSPKGFRVRSKKELNRRVKVDLTHFDFNQGIFVDGVITTKRGRSTRSSLSSSKANTLNHNIIHTPDKLTRTPQKPHLTPNTLAASVVTPSPSNEPYNSPPQLTQVSPVGPQAQLPSLSPSLRLGDLSPQILSHFTTPEKGKAALLAHSWLKTPLAPLSPTETPERDLFTHPSALTSSPGFQMPLDSSRVLNGGNQENGLSLSGCANCGCKYPGIGSGEELCPKCTSKKRQRSPHIIFKKVGQDKWVVGKTKPEGFLKKKISPLGKKHYASSLTAKRLEKEKMEEIKKQDSEDDDGADDDDQDFEPKKRKRRMCGQCKACLRDQDCGKCDFCMDKPKYGGKNKKRQKCRYRQCQFHSRLKTWRIMKFKKRFSLVDEGEDKKADEKADELEVRKHGTPRRKQKMKRRSWDNDFTDNEDDDDDDDDVDDNEDEDQRPRRKGRRGKGKKRRYSLKREEDEEGDEMGGPEIEEDGLDDPEEAQFVLCDDGNNVFYEELYPNSYSPSAQNGTVDSSGQPGMVESSQSSQDWVCTVAGFPEGSQVLGSVKLSSNGTVQFSNVPDKPAHLQVSNILSSNEQLSEALNRSWLDLIQVETTMPQVIPAPQFAPEPPDDLPSITQIYSLADIKENGPTEDPGLLELLSSLRRTVLPAHWVGVMAKGPLLQLFQCSKLSPMADTVLQIETDFYYQINVQNQPLLLTHPIYERHPQRLTSVSLVVALLLDLERLAVCQGYQSFEAGSRQGPLLCARAALCQLLIPQDDECCERCLLPVEA
ncbi:methyl-CpG-binding domain protein 1a isoform X1 [Pygocentrus nattereri]|uniref:CXXC-type domain-containing protein n=1 Tax=Pygocentrus nattereri TaxID=42514 RepID=A0AAR2JZV5_PYGNA|nr:methyl-CpG-binding domain protein 1a isoform X1 [Pygocentrus nattereri]XP_037391657.1 methyl-CpG-binding domain protein 1a isoform X1 [Pygocentrus nattereri]